MAELAQAPPRSAAPLPTPGARRRHLALVVGLAVVCLAAAVALLTWDNPLPFGTEGFWRVAQRRATNVVVLAVVALCQAVATVVFQTVTANRIITPSIMGFESLYVAVQTSAVYFFGVAGLLALRGVPQFLLQVALMVGFAVALYSWLLSGRHANLAVMLLVGIVIGAGLGSVATFMRRLLSPSEFDVLSARMFGNVSNADVSVLPVAVPLVVVALVLVWLSARRLDVVALGRDAATSLGLDHRREVMRMLLLVSVLMAVSTALVGPMTFFGFLVATLTYQLVGTSDHRHVLPVAALAAFAVLAGAYAVLKHVFYAQGVVSIIIEMVGGTLFLVVLLRKGRL